MRPHEKSFEEWRLLFLSSPRHSDVWWEALDNLPHTAQYSEDWSEYKRILDFEEFPSWHPECVIATNGILMTSHRLVPKIRKHGVCSQRIARFFKSFFVPFTMC